MPLLEITDLKKSFTSPEGTIHEVVCIPSFRLEAGQQMALSGSSGSGKTTFLHLIAGILAADSGSILFHETEVTRLSEAGRDRLRASSMGYIFQSFNLLQGFTAIENVLLGMTFGPGPDRARAGALLRRVGLGDRLHYRPRQLSTGQQQRVAAARALANRPRLILADEPTGNLDAASAREALQLIRETCTEFGAALLLVSHDPGVLASFENCQSLKELNHAGRAPAAANSPSR